MYVFIQPPLPHTRCNTRSIFKWSTTGLNSEFFFSKTEYQTMAILLFAYSWRENRWLHTFTKGISTKGNANSLVHTIELTQQQLGRILISSERSAFHVVINQSIAVHALLMQRLTSFSVDEILLPRYMNWSPNFRVLDETLLFINQSIAPSFTYA